MSGYDLKRIMIDAIESGSLVQAIESSLELQGLSKDDKVEAVEALKQLKLMTQDLSGEQERIESELQRRSIGEFSISRVEPDRAICLIGVEVPSQNATETESALRGLGYVSDAVQISSDKLGQRPGVRHYWFEDNRPFRVRLSTKGANRTAGSRSRDWAKAIHKRFRLVLNARVLRSRKSLEQNLGGFLGTPHCMIEPLLDFAGVNEETTLVDLGCGDARVLIHACQHFGCRGIGYELGDDLARKAEQLVKESGVNDKVTIIHGDALESDLEDADVVFAFLPVKTLPRLIDAVLKKMRRGAVLLCHEQEAFAPQRESEKHPIVTRQGVTIAHKWRVESTE